MLPFVDFLFVIACLTLGFGASLASYRVIALRNDWPMGELHEKKPLIPIMVGVFAIVISVLFAGARQYATSLDTNSHFDGWWIIFWGTMWGVLWTSTMRVGSQVALFLAPLSTVILIIYWAHARIPEGHTTGGVFFPSSYVSQRPLPDRTSWHARTRLWLPMQLNRSDV